MSENRTSPKIGNSTPNQATFRITLEPISSGITTDNLLQKLRLMAENCGLTVVSAERVDDQDEEPAWGITVL